MPDHAHVCTVRKVRERDEFRVSCSVCGPVGQPEEYYLDALALSDRHEELQGFEGRS